MKNVVRIVPRESYDKQVEELGSRVTFVSVRFGDDEYQCTQLPDRTILFPDFLAEHLIMSWQDSGHKKAHVPEMKPEDIVKPLSIMDDLSEEEILYWSTPHYDEIQRKKEMQKEKLQAEI